MSSVKYITPEELEVRYLRDRNLVLIDLRPPVEFRQVHVPRSLLVSPRNLSPTLAREHAGGNSLHEVYLLCRNGKQARNVAVQLAQLGRMDLFVIEGGIEAWEVAGLPVIRRRRSFTAEQRLRVAAGALVLAGTTLGLIVHPLCWIVPALVGVALLVAGLADTFFPVFPAERRRR